MPIVRGVVVCTLALIYFFVGMWLWSLFVSWSMGYFGWGIAFLWTALIFVGVFGTTDAGHLRGRQLRNQPVWKVGVWRTNTNAR